MTNSEIVKSLITGRANDLTVKSIAVVKDKNSMSHPCIRVGTLPYYDWSKKQTITFVITYGRYLNCRMLCDREYKNDKDFFVTDNIKVATKHLTKILSNL